MKYLILTLCLTLCSLGSVAQSFGYKKFKKCYVDGDKRKCNVSFIFNFNENGDVMLVDSDNAPTLLKAISLYESTDEFVTFDIEDVDGSIYNVKITRDVLIIENKFKTIIFTN